MSKMPSNPGKGSPSNMAMGRKAGTAMASSLANPKPPTPTQRTFTPSQPTLKAANAKMQSAQRSNNQAVQIGDKTKGNIAANNHMRALDQAIDAHTHNPNQPENVKRVVPKVALSPQPKPQPRLQVPKPQPTLQGVPKVGAPQGQPLAHKGGGGALKPNVLPRRLKPF